MSDQVLWYATRGAGAVSLVLLTVVVVLGITSAMRVQSAAWPRFVTTGLHRNLALMTLVFLAIHIITAIVDPFTALGIPALIPFASSYRTFWLGLGAVALYLLIAIVLTSLLRSLFGTRAWRAVHWLTYAMWPIALIHGFGTGSDSRFSWMLALDGVCIIAVALAVLWRTSRPSAPDWRKPELQRTGAR
jgi:predicted ferric reductase